MDFYIRMLEKGKVVNKVAVVGVVDVSSGVTKELQPPKLHRYDS